MRWFLLVVLALAPATAQSPEGGEGEGRPPFGLQVNRLLAGFRRLGDWETHSAYLVEAVEKVYARQGWTSEPDAFSLELVKTVNQIPPWAPFERFECAVGLLSERYGLDDEQEQVLRELAIRESTALFRKHAGRIMQYALEAVQTRASGQPFTPEQVARWSRLAEPVFQDGRKRVVAAAEALKAVLEPEQRLLLQKDLDALNRRLDDVQELSRKWQRGEWEPRDWGLEDDPIQNGVAAQAEAREVDQPPGDSETNPPRPPRSRQYRPSVGTPRSASQPVGTGTQSGGPQDAWARYVSRFIEKYHLEAEQQARAWKIYRDVRQRADQQRSRYGRRMGAALERVKNREGKDAQAEVRELEARLRAQLDRLYAELKRRLEPIPTRAQRRHASPVELEPRVAKPVPPSGSDGP